MVPAPRDERATIAEERQGRDGHRVSLPGGHLLTTGRVVDGNARLPAAHSQQAPVRRESNRDLMVGPLDLEQLLGSGGFPEAGRLGGGSRSQAPGGGRNG